jgi:Enoyl-(Acyl carrier protein) reductase
MECAAAGDGIRINTVHPGVIDPPNWTKMPAFTGSNAPIDSNEAARAGVPLKKAGRAQDIANRVLFLASDASSYMTGAELVIDGGRWAAPDLAGADAGGWGQLSASGSASLAEFPISISMGNSAVGARSKCHPSAN